MQKNTVKASAANVNKKPGAQTQVPQSKSKNSQPSFKMHTGITVSTEGVAEFKAAAAAAAAEAQAQDKALKEA